MTVQPLPVSVPQAEIDDFCRRHHVRRLALFGSVLRDDFRPDSDIDVLIEFEPGHAPGFAFFALEAELKQVLGREIDLNTPEDLSRYFREQVVSTAECLYAKEASQR